MCDSVFPLIDTLIRKTLLIYWVAVRMEQEHLETLLALKVRELNKCVPHFTIFVMQLRNDCIKMWRQTPDIVKCCIVSFLFI